MKHHQVIVEVAVPVLEPPLEQPEEIEFDPEDDEDSLVQLDHSERSKKDTDLWSLDVLDGDIDNDYSPYKFGSGVHVYIGDTGIRCTHKQFLSKDENGGKTQNRCIPTLESVGGVDHPKVCEPDDMLCATDNRGHGTHVAGTVAAKDYGTAPRATVHSVKVINDDGVWLPSWLIEGLDWVSKNAEKPAVMSLSLGVTGIVLSVQNAVQAATEAGVTMVIAAGNENQPTCDTTPASSQFAIKVGAINEEERRCYFSNYGKCTDIYAPGMKIKSTSNRSDSATEKRTGTSMAAPAVSGVVAGILQEYPYFTPAEVKKLLLQLALKGSVKENPQGTPNFRLSVPDRDSAGYGTIAPTPVPSPTLPPTLPVFEAFEVTSGACTVPVDQPTCIQSPNYPANYGSFGYCEITIPGGQNFWEGKTLKALDFLTEACCDTLTVNGQGYSGLSFPSGLSPMSTIHWTADETVHSTGWKICSSVTPQCKKSCNSGNEEWSTKCAYENKECTACDECCKAWCHSNAAQYDWSKTCLLPSCVGCQSCN
jgi:hypothetical protein